MNTTYRLLMAAATANGIATGATLDQAIKQLPARHELGSVAYADYVRAADLGNGLIWYPIMGIGTAALSLTAALHGLQAKPGRPGSAALIALTIGTASHLTATTRAAPTLLGLRHAGIDDTQAGDILNRFAQLNRLRATALVATLAAVVWALAAIPKNL